MELRHRGQFIAVAETRSFRRAAERLCMAQPPLSVAIRKLGEEIGIALAYHAEGESLVVRRFREIAGN